MVVESDPSYSVITFILIPLTINLRRLKQFSRPSIIVRNPRLDLSLAQDRRLARVRHDIDKRNTV